MARTRTPREGRFGGLVPVLIGLGVTPGMVSVAGLLFALCAAVCLTLGAGHVLPWETASGAPRSGWPPIAGGFLVLAAVADLLDGDLARRGDMQSPYGALLDSTLDRISDIAIFAGCALYFASLGNLTWVLVSSLALSEAVLISYVKARGENFVDGLEAGFWQRGERIATLLCGAFFGRMPAALCLLAFFPAFTIWRRMREARLKMAGRKPLPVSPRLARSAPWRQRRSSLPYTSVCLSIAIVVLVAPWLHSFFLGVSDPLGEALRAARP
jgi:CDP-diacylglycerol--glycerol-3-phosphate 3-phosphatidyltransferase